MEFNVSAPAEKYKPVATCEKVRNCGRWHTDAECSHLMWLTALPESNNGTCRDKLTTKMCLAYSYGQSEGPNSLLQWFHITHVTSQMVHGYYSPSPVLERLCWMESRENPEEGPGSTALWRDCGAIKPYWKHKWSKQPCPHREWTIDFCICFHKLLWWQVNHQSVINLITGKGQLRCPLHYCLDS